MMPEPLTLVCPSAGPRLRDVIETALCDLPVRNAQGDLRGARILFALDAGSAGMDEPTLRLLRRLRTEPGCLNGSVCGFVVDGETELYTKALAQDLTVIIVINKVDRPDARLDEVVDEVLELMLDLGASDEQLDAPVVFCSARQGAASFLSLIHI